MPRVRKPPSVFEWLFCGAVFCVGLFFVAVYAFNSANGITAEKDLTFLEGPTEDATLITITGRYGKKSHVVEFKVKGLKTEYGDSDPGYEQVLGAVQSGEAVKLWVSEKRETILPRAGFVPLYKMEFHGKTLVEYDQTVKGNQKNSNSALIVGGFISALGLWSLNTCRVNAKLKTV